MFGRPLGAYQKTVLALHITKAVSPRLATA
jgi:hypothetical protein